MSDFRIEKDTLGEVKVPSNVDAVMNGAIDGFLKSYLMQAGAASNHPQD